VCGPSWPFLPVPTSRRWFVRAGAFFRAQVYSLGNFATPFAPPKAHGKPQRENLNSANPGAAMVLRLGKGCAINLLGNFANLQKQTKKGPHTFHACEIAAANAPFLPWRDGGSHAGAFLNFSRG
jgi:hypothetical protein